MDNLKRCPFCGELPTTEVMITQKSGLNDIILFSVTCGKCGTSKGVRLTIKAKAGTFFEVEKAMEEATKAWNTRWNDG